MKIAIISGASSGLGRTFATQLDDQKLDEIWVIARREDRLRALESELQTPVRVFAFDLIKSSSFEVFKHILAQENPVISYLINAAGFGVMGSYDMDLQVVNDTLDLNIKALVNMSYLCIPYMVEGSQLIQVGSMSAFTPLKNFNVYAATKAFVVHFSNALYAELKGRKIKVSVVCPGWVNTEFIDKATHTTVGPRFKRPLYSAQRVVRTALRDSARGAMISLPGAISKCHYIAAKFLPKKLTMAMWNAMQKNK